MQNVFPDTYLATVEEDKTIPTIINTKDIPNDENQIKQYLASSMKRHNQTFHGKVYMLTNHTMQEYKGDSFSNTYKSKKLYWK
jgi:hypothetical protein